jgi:hypothetical protein
MKYLFAVSIKRSKSKWGFNECLHGVVVIPQRIGMRSGGQTKLGVAF